MNNHDLKQTLEAFSQAVNQHPRLTNLLASWEPTIVIEAHDTGLVFSLLVRGGRIEKMVPERTETEHTIHLQADEQTLQAVFTGHLNPARAHLNGSLVVSGSDPDQVKLDALSLILWGA